MTGIIRQFHHTINLIYRQNTGSQGVVFHWQISQCVKMPTPTFPIREEVVSHRK